MHIQPNAVLKGWLLEHGLEAEAEAGLELADEQVAMLDRLRDEAKRNTHYNDVEREAWTIWTAFTHAGFKSSSLVTPSHVNEADRSISEGLNSLNEAVLKARAVLEEWERMVVPVVPASSPVPEDRWTSAAVWLRWLVLLAALAWRHF